MASSSPNYQDTFDNFDLPDATFRSRCNTWPRQLQIQQQQQQQHQQPQQQRRLQQQQLTPFYHPSVQDYGQVKEFGSQSGLNSVQAGSFMLATRLISPGSVASPWRPKVTQQSGNPGRTSVIHSHLCFWQTWEVVEHTPHDWEVMGSNPIGCWDFSLLYLIRSVS